MRARRRIVSRTSLLLATAALVLLAACEPSDGPRGAAMTGDSAALLVDRDGVEAIRAGYSERLRLGLGSPFRLIDFALQDPRLTRDARRDLADDLLDRTRDGEAFEIDPMVLLPSRPPPRERLQQAVGHLELIDGIVSEADDPRAGELTVRLAYRIALLEATVEPALPATAAAVAALVRDRELAVRDARTLIAAARAAGDHPIDLVGKWREERRFMVEAPIVQPVDERQQGQAIRSIPRVLGAIRRIARGEIAAMGALHPAELDPDALLRLQAIGDSTDMPPRAGIVVAVRGVGTALPSALGEADRRAWRRFEASSLNEERFVSRSSDLLERHPLLRTAVSTAALYAAVGMRVDAQEAVWYPGSGAPAVARLQGRHGIVFEVAGSVPARWVPYYTAHLDEALSELRRVIPRARLHGLTIRLSRDAPSRRTLASFEARTRVLELPATTGPGTLAHEIAHDLDYQAATVRREGAVGYGSENAGGPAPAALTAAIAILTPATPGTPEIPATPIAHANRPAEIVARTFDWFVTTRLGSIGRSSGMLSSAQDEVFTGNGSLGPPGVSEAYGRAVVQVVRSLVPIADEHRAAFLTEYGRLRWPGPYAMLDALASRLIAAADEGPRASAGGRIERFASISALGDQALLEIDASRCEGRLPLQNRALLLDYRALLVHAVTASARAAALRAAEELGGAPARDWMTRELYRLPRGDVEIPPDILSPLQALAEEARTVREVPPPLFHSGFEFQLSPDVARCHWSHLGSR